jgi:hypothetical protein
MAPFQSTSAAQTGKSTTADVVEIGLLLHTSRVNALIELSKKKHQSVGQLLRGLIDRALVDGGLDDRLEDFREPCGANGLGTFV